MNVTDLREQMEIELEKISATLAEIHSLKNDLQSRSPTIREKTAAGAFLGQLYTGLENILLRICKYRGVALPTGDEWHIELFRKFCEPPQSGLPLLFDKKLEDAIAPYRRFRHLFAHTYGVLLDWERMRDGVTSAHDVFTEFAHRVRAYLRTF
jgi:hypothetical protein